MKPTNEPFWLTRDGAFKVTVEQREDTTPAFVVYSWSEDFGKAGDWVPVAEGQDSRDLERHFPDGSLHEFEVPDFPPDEGMVSA
jgi:hypothetical protein